ncbi:hypothetical protein CPAR01_07799 [Colletotrichum paranaense]|uniref:Uncharacterized protein n=1 Tax=Colletotrichum paranaense TaxID=1914294 RepID=A0ABQ9SIS0_9PEZI|nr:uncharacterized protein CPAR01_07799 [Colletotrichum paranaense]KAK1537686.1 hypothetical protein CPAR01_07799 [Colletotrichum paranaense]
MSVVVEPRAVAPASTVSQRGGELSRYGLPMNTGLRGELPSSATALTEKPGPSDREPWDFVEFANHYTEAPWGGRCSLIEFLSQLDRRQPLRGVLRRLILSSYLGRISIRSRRASTSSRSFFPHHPTHFTLQPLLNNHPRLLTSTARYFKMKILNALLTLSALAVSIDALPVSVTKEDAQTFHDMSLHETSIIARQAQPPPSALIPDATPEDDMDEFEEVEEVDDVTNPGEVEAEGKKKKKKKKKKGKKKGKKEKKPEKPDAIPADGAQPPAAGAQPAPAAGAQPIPAAGAAPAAAPAKAPAPGAPAAAAPPPAPAPAAPRSVAKAFMA